MFFDNASTTKVDKAILDQFKNINDDYFYNPGALYSAGRAVRKLIDSYRLNILTALNGVGKIIFTGSATEANNLALRGLVKKNTRKILISMGEHPSVYNTALELIQQGHCVEFVNLTSAGIIDICDFEKKMTSEVDIVSIMHVSNETGAINDIKTLVEYAKEINPKVIFHVDGVQAVGKVDVDLDDLDVDMYTISAHKIHGLKGAGALFTKNNIALKPIIWGGGQEGGLRSGTENVLGIYSLAYVVENSVKEQKANYQYVSTLKEQFLAGLEKSNIEYSLHSNNECSPYIVSIAFLGCKAETLLNLLSDKNIFVGNGSACSSKKSGNRILENMGVDKSGIEGNLRISFSKYNTVEEVTALIDGIRNTVAEYLKKVRN